MEEENIYGYGRVSTKGQNLDRQIKSLLEFGVKEENIFTDKQSGKDFNRDSYQLLKQFLKRTKNNVLIIKSIDRLGRNYKEIQKEWREITIDLKTDIVVLDMLPLLDTRKYKNDTMGNFINDIILQLLSYIAENERDNIRNRQKEGIEISKKKGVKFGRPSIPLPPNFIEEYNIWRKGDQTTKSTMEHLGLKKSNFYKLVREFEENNKMLKVS